MLMKIYSTSELRRKDVVNVCNGRRIGCASDFEFDPCSGKITALIIPGDCGFFGIGSKCDIVIPWGRVECFGEDTVLVKLSERELCEFLSTKGKRKRC